MDHTASNKSHSISFGNDTPGRKFSIGGGIALSPVEEEASDRQQSNSSSTFAGGH